MLHLNPDRPNLSFPAILSKRQLPEPGKKVHANAIRARAWRKRRALVVSVLTSIPFFISAASPVMAAGTAQPLTVIADSVRDFSGTQGGGSWHYGYYPGPFTASAFHEMTEYVPNAHPVFGSEWFEQSGSYWTQLWAVGGHPNGASTTGGRVPVEQWAVRRWISTATGTLTLTGTLAKLDTGGDGTTGHIIVDGQELWKQPIGGFDTTGINYNVSASVHSGSTVDFAISPGPTDNNDSTKFTATVSAPADNDLSLSQPPNITANATGPSGATLSYTLPTVQDAVPTTATPTCAPPSGTVFPIGTTKVSCSVTDPDDAGGPATATFTITVNSAGVQLDALYHNVQGVGPGTSLSDKVQQARSYLAAGDTVDTCSTLVAFIHEVQAQSGKNIPTDLSNRLVAEAGQIQTVLAC